mgnify:CR=1 FL=1
MEPARGRPVDRRADLWAFGVIIFELLTGRQLFAGETVSDTLAAVLRKEPDWQALPVDEAPELCRLIERCPENTWFMIMSDHGELFGEDGYFGHGPIMHEKVFEVPFVEGKRP